MLASCGCKTCVHVPAVCATTSVCVLSVSRRRVFELVAEARSEETFIALCLLSVTGASLLTQRMGFSDTLGAFAAGVLLSGAPRRQDPPCCCCGQCRRSGMCSVGGRLAGPTRQPGRLPMHAMRQQAPVLRGLLLGAYRAGPNQSLEGHHAATQRTWQSVDVALASPSPFSPALQRPTSRPRSRRTFSPSAASCWACSSSPPAPHSTSGKGRGGGQERGPWPRSGGLRLA